MLHLSEEYISKHLVLLFPLFMGIAMPCFVVFLWEQFDWQVLYSRWNKAETFAYIVIAASFVVLYFSLLYSSIKTYLLSLEYNSSVWSWPLFRIIKEHIIDLQVKQDLWQEGIETIEVSSLSGNSKQIIQSIKNINDLFETKETDKEEIEKLELPCPKIDEKGYPSLDGFIETLNRCASIKPKERKSILDYGRIKLEHKTEMMTIKELAAIMVDTPMYMDVTEGFKGAAHELKLDNLIESAKEISHSFEDLTTSALHDALGDTFADQISSIDIPVASSIFEGYKQGRKILDGDINIGDALAQSGSKIALKSIYGGAGALLGSAFGPLGTMAGGFIGNYIGSIIANDIKSQKYNDMVASLRSYKNDCDKFLEETQREWNDAQANAALEVYNCHNKKKREFCKTKSNSPLDRIDQQVFCYTICIVVKDYLVQLITTNRIRNIGITKYIPNNQFIKGQPLESLKSLLYATELANRHVDEFEFYNRSLIISECIKQLQFDFLNLQFTHNRWVQNIYDKYYSSINDIASVYKKENDSLDELYSSIENENIKRQEELKRKMDEAEKEKRRIK